MFNFFKKKPQGKIITLNLQGLHCSSCSLNIDSEIEDLTGVYSVSTSYAKQICVIDYDPQMVTPKEFIKVIEGLGYKVIKSS